MKIEILVICEYYWNSYTLLVTHPFWNEDKSAAKAVAVKIWMTILKLLLNIPMHNPCLLTSLMFLWEVNGRSKSEGLKWGILPILEDSVQLQDFKRLAKKLSVISYIWILWCTFALQFPIGSITPCLSHYCCTNLHYLASIWDIWIKIPSSLVFCYNSASVLFMLVLFSCNYSLSLASPISHPLLDFSIQPKNMFYVFPPQ